MKLKYSSSPLLPSEFHCAIKRGMGSASTIKEHGPQLMTFNHRVTLRVTRYSLLANSLASKLAGDKQVKPPNLIHAIRRPSH
jgi:hypothetical protein